MPNWESRSLRLATLLLVLAGYFALSSVQEYGQVLVGVPLLLFALVPVGERLDSAFPAYRQVTRALQIGYLFFIPYTYITLGSINALVALIVFIQAHTLLHLKTPRNYYHLFLMAFFMLLTAAVQSPEPAIALAFILFAVSGVWGMAALRLDADAHVHRERSVEPVPEGGIETAGGETRTGTDWRVGLCIAGLCTAVLVCTVGLFIVTPRIEAGLFGRDEVTEVRRTGLTDRVSLRGGGPIEQDMTAVMYVEFPELEEGFLPGPKYWRSTTLAQYANGEWRRRGLGDHLEPGFGGAVTPFRRAALPLENPPHAVQRPRDTDRRVVRQRIYMDNVPQQGLPCLDRVQAVQVVGEPGNTRIQWDPFNDFTVTLEMRGPRRITYDVWSETPTPADAALRGAPDDYELILSNWDYLLLTEHDLLPGTQALGDQIVAGARTPYDKAVAIERWLSGDDFAYTLDLPDLGARRPIDAFLMQERRGHCELFGSAMALLLRSQGIPARVVTGFRDGEWNEGNRSYIVRASDAHLWVEVYFPGHGWVVFDPSPRVEPGTGGFDRFTRNVSRVTFELKMFWYQNIIGYESRFNLAGLRDTAAGIFRSGRFGLPGDGQVGAFRFMRTPWALLAGLSLAAAAGFAVYMRRHAPRGRRYVLTRDQARAVRLYRLALRRLRKTMVVRGADMTAEEWMSALEAVESPPSAAAEALTMYNQVRFGLRPLDDAEYRRIARNLRARRA